METVEVEKKYCTSCTSMRPAEGGRIKQSRRIKRWQCKGCAEGKTESIYSRKPKEVLIDNGD